MILTLKIFLLITLQVGKDTYVMVRKIASMAVRSVTTCTPNFMVKKDYLLGTDISSTEVWTRC